MEIKQKPLPVKPTDRLKVGIKESVRFPIFEPGVRWNIIAKKPNLMLIGKLGLHSCISLFFMIARDGSQQGGTFSWNNDGTGNDKKLEYIFKPLVDVTINWNIVIKGNDIFLRTGFQVGKPVSCIANISRIPKLKSYEAGQD